VLHDSLHVEWCKSRARAMRFTEEVELLQEEMERVVRSRMVRGLVHAKDFVWVGKV